MKSPILICIIIFSALGCNRSVPKNSAFKIQLTSEPVSLDFSTAEDGISMRILGFLMSAPMRVNGKGELVPEMAERIETLQGGKLVRVHLKKWSWSDGVSVKASDFIFAIKRTLDPQVRSKLCDLLFFIRNAVLYKNGKIKDFTQVGVKQIDEQTLEFQLESSFIFFPQLLALSILFPQRKDLFEKYGDKWVEKMETTGPYKLLEWKHQRSVVLEKNKFYPQAKQSAIPERVEFNVIADEMTALNLFDADKMDLVTRIPALEMDRFVRSGMARDFPYFATYYLGFNFKIKPWDQKAARLALASSLDRAGIMKALSGGDREASSWIPAGIPDSNPAIGIKKDLQKAASSWKKVSGVKTFSEDSFVLGFDSGARNQMIVEKVKQDVKNAMGVDLKLKARDWKTYVRELTTNTPAIFRFGFLSLFADPFAHLFLFESGNPNNYTGWKSARYDELLSQIARLDPLKEHAKRKRLVDQAQKILCEEEIVVVPLYHYIQRVLVSKRVRKIEINGLGLVDLKTLEVVN